MSFFRKLRELVIGKPERTRDELCAILQSYGIEARLADRKCPEEKIGSGRWRNIGPVPFLAATQGISLGVIDVTTGLIRWVNVLEYQFEDSPTDYWYVYCIMDQRLYLGFPSVHLKSALIRKSWLGEVIGVKWKGEDYSLGIVERLSQPSITKVIFDSYRQGIAADLEIDAEPGHGCWAITIKTVPSQELWNCYQSIAARLLEMPSPDDILAQKQGGSEI
jgi:hypothetical protein